MITNNGISTHIYLCKNRQVDIACIFCIQVYRYFTYKDLIIKDNELCCPECSVKAMIAITPGSILYDMEGEEKKEYMKEMHNKLFL
jgi:hypothetical protein